MLTERFELFKELFDNSKYWNPSFQKWANTHSDLYICPDQEDIRRFKLELRIDLSEDVIFIGRSQSSWYLITSFGIYKYLKWTDWKCEYFKKWEDIHGIKMGSSCIVINCESKDWEQRLNFPNNALGFGGTDVEAQYEALEIFNQLLNGSQANFFACLELFKVNKYQECIVKCREEIKKRSNEIGLLYSLLSNCYNSLGQYANALSVSNEGLSIEDIPDLQYRSILMSRFDTYKKLGDLGLMRKDAFAIFKLTPPDKMDQKEGCWNVFCSVNEEYRNSFLGCPYQKRKVLLIVDTYDNLYTDNVVQFSKEDADFLSFPLGHPIAKHIYVGHPLIPSKYIPFDYYQLELVEDKVREFCVLVQNLGATEISIENLNTSSSDNNKNGKRIYNGGANILFFDGNASYQTDFSHHIIDELSRSISLHQTFEPHNKPAVPDGMIWYINEPSWQRLAAQRLSGGLSSHEERIETRKIQMIDGRELSELKAEIDSLYLDLNMSMDKSEEPKFEQQENAILSIKVKFAPLSQLTGLSNDNIISSVSYSSSEQEYLDEVKECLADGEIGPRERRLLDKIREKLGITPERAAELEATLAAPQLTDDEKEYLTEFKECAVDGVVSDKERRLLEKMRNMLGISEGRAKELERL